MPLPTLNTEGINIIPGLTTAANLRSASQQNYLNQLKMQEGQLDIGLKQKAIERLKFQDEKDALDYLYNSAPMITYDNYDKSKQHLIDLGLNPDALPDKSSFGVEGTPEAKKNFEKFKIQGMTTIADKIKLYESSIKETPAEKRQLDLEAKKDLEDYKSEKTTPTTAMGKFIKDNPEATPDEIALFAQKLKGKGIEVTTADGTTISIGGSVADMSAKSKGAIEEKITAGKESLARLLEIKSQFKPEYQEIGTRLAAAWTGLKAKLGQGVDEKDANLLTDFKKYQRRSIENINLYIKELTGAQMSEKEANRLRLAQPDPGEKWYKGDDPITFQSKIDDVIRAARASIARYEYYRAKGFSHEKIKEMVGEDKVVSLDDIAAQMK